MIKVLLADDHAIVRQGLQYFLSLQEDIEVIGEAASGTEAVTETERLLPDVVLMDLQMPGMNGIEAIRRIRETNQTVKMIVLTSFSDRDHVLSAIKAGASGYLLKDADPLDIAASIRHVMAGQPSLHPVATSQLMEHVAANASSILSESGNAMHNLLTEREKDILRHIASGMSNKEIAASCGISEKTVKTHVSNVLGKLQLADRTQAALYAVKHGLA
jgi:two-component system, NarL family, response regulator LiaR